MFHLALLPISRAMESANWITDQTSPEYLEIDVIDLPDKIIEQVFSLYQLSYDYLEGARDQKSYLNNPVLLQKYDRWILFHDDSDPNKNIVAFVLYRTTACGLKAGLSGQNGVSAHKKPLITFKIKSFNLEGVFGEISGRLEELILTEVPRVKATTAESVLAKLGKTIEINDSGEGFHYSRNIKNIGVIRKVMVGQPILDT